MCRASRRLASPGVTVDLLSAPLESFLSASARSQVPMHPNTRDAAALISLLQDIRHCNTEVVHHCAKIRRFSSLMV
jgi:hypothetical protein